MRSQRASLLLGMFAVVSAVSALLMYVISGNATMSFLAFALVAVIGIGIYFASARGLLAACAFLLVPPGIIGEGSLALSVTGCTILVVVALSFRSSYRFVTGHAALLFAAFIAAGSTMFSVGLPVNAIQFLATALIALLAMNRRDFIVSTFKGIAFLFGVLSVSYLITLITGFHQAISILRFGTRSLELYFPLTLATSGPPVIEGTRRFSPLIGEPGLSIYFIIPILMLLLTTKSSPSKRLVGLIGVAAFTLFTQSFATYVAVAVGIGAYALGLLALRARRPVLTIIVGAATALGGFTLIVNSLNEKAERAAESVGDRGILDTGSLTEASLGNINLIVAFTNNPGLAYALLAALFLLGVFAIQSIAGFAVFIMFTLTAVFAQPSQWQVGGWALYAMALALPLLGDHSEIDVAVEAKIDGKAQRQFATQ